MSFCYKSHYMKINDRKILISFLFLLFYISGLSAQPVSETSDTLKITLQDAILLGLDNNPTLNIQRLDPELTNTIAKEESGAFDPVLGASLQKSTSKSQRRLGASRTPFDMKDERFDYSAQISEALPTGTILNINAGMTGSISNLYTDQYSGTLGFTITQSLLQGLGFGYNLANLRQAKLDVEISKSELKGMAENVIAQIETGYWDVYLTEKETAIQKQSLELAEKQLFESLERVKVGKLPKLEIAAVEAEVAARRSALIDAQSQNEQARLQLIYLLNPQLENLWSSVPSTLDQPFLPEDSLDTIPVHEKLGMKYRPDLEQARFALKKGELEVSRTKNGLLPKLDFFISMGRTTYSEFFDKAYPDINSPFYQISGGLTFEFPVPNRQASARLDRAKFSKEQEELAVKNMEKTVQLDVRSSYTEVLRSRQQIEATRVTRELQDKKLAAEVEKFRVGKSTNILVLQAQRDYTTSQLEEARAMVAYLDALLNLYVAEGTLLQRRGIETF
jgi:outer membrane protein